MSDAATLTFDLKLPLGNFDLKANADLRHRITGVFGSSGSGKTSLVESLIGLRSKASGTIEFAGKPWLHTENHTRLKLQQRNIGYLPQQHFLFPHMNVAQNLAYGEDRARTRGLDVEQLKLEVVETLELGSLLYQKPEQLSGGERQRVALGRALCSGPEILMLDEPLSSLDIRLRKRILPFLLKTRDHFKLPMLIVSHHPMELMTLCDEVLVMDKGRIVAQDKPLAVFSEKSLYLDVAAEGFRNVVNGVVDVVDGHTSCVRIGATQVATVIGTEFPVGSPVKLSFSPTDVLLSRSKVTGISARNQWLAEIVSIEMIGDQVIVMCDLLGSDDCRAVIELTTDAFDELKITKGSDVFLILKSSSIEVIG